MQASAVEETYGLYLALENEPRFTGTQAECRNRVGGLSDTEREQGWTVCPLGAEVPEEFQFSAKALVWTGIALLFILALLEVPEALSNFVK